MFVPFCDFEEVFRSAAVASDGQYKVQLFSQAQGFELYVPRQGRFNLEGYVGGPTLERGIATNQHPNHNLTHPQVQTLLVGVGRMKGYEVYVPPADQGKLDWSLTARVDLKRVIPNGFRSVSEVLAAVDVIWVHAGRDRIEALFEVEHTTSIYSGLLRLNDLLLAEPKLSRFSIVADECRRSGFSRQLRRPTFQRSGLAEVTSFMEYSNVYDWHARLALQERAAAAGETA